MKGNEEVSFREPMLAKLSHEVVGGKGWIFERKLDGERCIAVKDGDTVLLYSRNEKRINEHYPEIVEALEGLKPDTCIVDGEIVAFEGDVTSFSLLQNRMHAEPDRSIQVYFYLFDILHIDGKDTEDKPLRERKKVLKRKIEFEDPLRYTPHRNRSGEKFLDEACRKGWEGLIAKKADSTYAHSRSSNWLKQKCGKRQEFVLCGFTEPEGERIGFGALLLCYYRDDELIYAGKVGTGYDHRTLKSLRKKMDRIERNDPAVAGDDLPDKGVHWIEPKLVGEVGFTEWTDDGKLRHPRFLGLREDKDPKDVVREN